MKSRMLIRTIAIHLLATLAGPLRLAAQEQHEKHLRYKLIDLGTFGGPHSYGSVNGDGFQLLNNDGVVASYADLAVPDPNAAFFCYVPDCSQAHASECDGEHADDGGCEDATETPITSKLAPVIVGSRAAGQSVGSASETAARVRGHFGRKRGHRNESSRSRL